MLFGFIPESFSEQDIKSVMIFVDPPKNDKVTIQENQNEEDEKPSPNLTPTLPDELPTVFVTGNDYSLNSNPILISSNEGIALNNLLIEQIDEWKNDAEHTDDFWSRTDQVIMGNFGVVNALQNPLSKNNYLIDGQNYSQNVKSNLDYFVFERGFDGNDLESVPNHMVSPKKYDLSRAIMKQWENPLSNNLNTQHVRDLRDVVPHAFDFSPEQEMQMFRESVKTTSFEVVGSLMPRLIVDDSMFLPESNSETKMDPDNSSMNEEKESVASGISESEQEQKQQQKQQEMIQEQQQNEIFQQTSHLKDMIANSNFEPNYTIQQEQELPLFEIITSIVVSLISVIALYILKKYYRKISKPETLITVKSQYDYLSDVESLLNQAAISYKNTFIKDAYEKLSQSMRLFYSHKLELEKEVVTSDLIPLMKNFNESEKSLVKKSLYLSDMIEFAKHSEEKKQFEKILIEFSKIIRDEKI